MRHFHNVRDRRQIVCVEQSILRSNVWDGGGADDYLATADNWATAQSPESGDTLHFAGTVRPNPINNYPVDTKFQSLVFDTGSAGFYLTGNRFELLGSIIQNDNTVQEVLPDMIVNNSVNFIVNTGVFEIKNILGTGSITLSGNSPWSVRFVGNSTFSGQLTIQNNVYADVYHSDSCGTGTIALNGGSIRAENTIALSNNITLDGTNHGLVTAESSDTLTLNGVISGAGELRFGWSTSTVVVNGVNTYTGKTIIGAAGPASGMGTPTVRFNSIANGGANSAFGAGSVVEIGQASVSRNATLEYIGSGDSTNRTFSLVGSGGTLKLSNNGTGTLTLTHATPFPIADGSKTLEVDGTNTILITGALANPTSGTLSLTKSGAGTTILSGANTYTGNTTISGGTLQIGNGGSTGALSTSSAIVNNGTLVFNRSSTIIGGTNFNNVISGSGGVRQSGSGLLVFAGTQTYSGPTTIDVGTTLQLGNNSSGGALSLSSAIVNNGTFSIRRSNNVAQGTDFGSVISGSGIVQHNPNTGTTYVLTLNGVNTFSGGVNIVRAALVVSGSNSALGTGTVTLGTATLRMTVTDGLTIANNIIVNTGSGSGANGRGVIENSGTGNATISGTITNNGQVANGGLFASVSTGTLTLSGAITSNSYALVQRLGIVIYSGGGSYTPGLLVQAGTARVGATNGLATNAPITLGQLATANLDLNGFDQSLAGITKSTNAANVGNSSTTSNSTLTLTGTCSWAGLIQNVLGSGTRTVSVVINSSGVVTFSSSNTYSGETTLTAGTFNINHATAIGTGTFTINGGTIDNTTGGLITLTNNNPQTWAGDFTYNGTTAALNVGTGTVTLTGNRQVTVSAQSLQVGGAIVGAYTLTKLGASGSLVLTGACTYSGPTTVSEGILQIGVGGTSGSITSDISISIGATLGFSRSDAYTYTGVISGAGIVVKMSAGTLTLSGINTYTGSTSIIGGTLQITGSLANTAVSVSGGTLLGRNTTGDSATIIGTVTLTNSASSIIQPGSFGDNTLNTGALTFSGSSAKMIANSTTTTFSQIAVTGDVALGGCTIDFPAGITTNGTYKLITATGTMSGTLPIVGTNGTGKTLTLQQTGNDLEVVVS
jgi:autotransporter-associated beta strand protein